MKRLSCWLASDDPTRTVEQILDLRVETELAKLYLSKSLSASTKSSDRPRSETRWGPYHALFGEVDEKVTSGKLANDQIAPMVAELSKNFKSVKIETGGEGTS